MTIMTPRSSLARVDCKPLQRQILTATLTRWARIIIFICCPQACLAHTAARFLGCSFLCFSKCTCPTFLGTPAEKDPGPKIPDTEMGFL